MDHHPLGFVESGGVGGLANAVEHAGNCVPHWLVDRVCWRCFKDGGGEMMVSAVDGEMSRRRAKARAAKWAWRGTGSEMEATVWAGGYWLAYWGSKVGNWWEVCGRPPEKPNRRSTTKSCSRDLQGRVVVRRADGF
jgi:hypothetical protein